MVRLSWLEKLRPSVKPPTIIEIKQQLYEDAGAIFLNIERYKNSGQFARDAHELAEQSQSEESPKGYDFAVSMNKTALRSSKLSHFDPADNVTSVHPADIKAFQKAFVKYSQILNDTVLSQHETLPRHIRDMSREMREEPGFYTAKELVLACEQTQDIPEQPLYKVVASLLAFCDHANAYGKALLGTDTVELPGR